MAKVFLMEANITDLELQRLKINSELTAATEGVVYDRAHFFRLEFFGQVSNDERLCAVIDRAFSGLPSQNYPPMPSAVM